MTSQKQIEANRKNSQHSTGPKSEAGRAAVRFNALKSGIDAESQIIPGESIQDFHAYAESISESFHPADQGEQDLVDQIVTHGWRLRRLFKIEPQAWSRALAAGVGNLADAFDRDPQFFPRLQRLIASVQRSYHQAAAGLTRLQAARAKSAQAQAQADDEADDEIPRHQELVWANRFDPAAPPFYPCRPADDPANLAASAYRQAHDPAFAPVPPPAPIEKDS